jgi:hypothetical protein
MESERRKGMKLTDEQLADSVLDPINFQTCYTRSVLKELQLRRRLGEYVRHLSGCPKYYHATRHKKCDCDLQSILDELEAL